MKALPSLAILVLGAQGLVGEEPFKETESLVDLLPILESELKETQAPVTEFSATYEEHLKSLSDETQKEGELEKLLLIRKELDTYADGGLRDYSSFPKLSKLRSIYDTNYPKKAADVIDLRAGVYRLYLSRSEELKKIRTQEGDLEIAVKLAEEEKRIVDLVAKGAEEKDSLGAPTSAAAEPKEIVAWELKADNDYLIHGRAEMARSDGIYKLTGPEHHRILTNRTFKPPSVSS
ncbi:MAG: hypothetical protein AAF585_17990 [Verrucomicrobiota bacterium]